MDTIIGREWSVTLHHHDMSVRDLVNEQAAKASREGNDRHFYMCDLGDIINKYQKWVQLMPRVKPFYAVKCNDEFPVLKVLSDLGASFDCASKNEIEKVLDLGVSPTRIIYAHPCKQASMLSFAQQKGVDLVTFDDVEELYKVKRIHPLTERNFKTFPPNGVILTTLRTRNVPIPDDRDIEIVMFDWLVLRITIISEFKGKIDLSSKYGSHPANVSRILQVAKELELNVIGVSFHVGSNCYESEAFTAAIEQAHNAFKIGLEIGFRMKLLDIGGGFPGQLNTYAIFHKITRSVNKSLQKYFPPEDNVEIIAEPGRYMVASAATIGVNIIAKRVIPSILITKDQDEKVPDCANQDRIMYYVNDGVYGSFLCKVVDEEKYEAHHLKAIENVRYYESCIWGPTCDSTDCIIESTKLPLHEVGEWLYFRDMGAYTIASATQFNGMEAPRRVYYSHANIWYKLYPNQRGEKNFDCNNYAIG